MKYTREQVFVINACHICESKKNNKSLFRKTLTGFYDTLSMMAPKAPSLKLCPHRKKNMGDKLRNKGGRINKKVKTISPSKINREKNFWVGVINRGVKKVSE